LAIASLLEEGVPPNCINVRKALGGRGSGADLSKKISAWYREFGPSVIDRIASKRAEIAQGSPRGLVIHTADDVVIALQKLTSKRNADPNRGVEEVFVDVFGRIGNLLDKMLAWEHELDREAVQLSALRARLIEVQRQKSTSKVVLTGSRSPKKSMPRP